LGGRPNPTALLFVSSIRFDLWEGLVLKNRVIKHMGKKDQEEERWAAI